MSDSIRAREITENQAKEETEGLEGLEESQDMTVDASVANVIPASPESEAGPSLQSVCGEEELRAVLTLIPDEAQADIVDMIRSSIISCKPFLQGQTKAPVPYKEDAPALAEYRRRHPDLPSSENKAKAIRRSDEYWEIVKALGGRDMRPRTDPEAMAAWDALSKSLDGTDDIMGLLRLAQQAQEQLRPLCMTSVKAKTVDAVIQAGFPEVVDEEQASSLAGKPSRELRHLLSEGNVVNRLKRWIIDTYSDWNPYDDGYGDAVASVRTPTTVDELLEMLDWTICEGAFIQEEILGASRWDHGQSLDKPSKAARRLYLRSNLGKATKSLSEAWGVGDIVVKQSTLGMAREARDRVCDILEQEFDWNEIVRLVSENPRYKAMFEAERNMERGILDRIPENPIDLYPIARSMSRHFVLHIGPTNSGKTHDAMTVLGKAPSGIYLAPLRLLAYEQYERLNGNGCLCSLLTGEEDLPAEGARHVALTIEMLDFSSPIDVAVIDEAQMLADPERGSHWTAAILGVPATEVHVCLAPEAEQIVRRLIKACGDSIEVVRHERMTELRHEDGAFNFPKDVRKGDALIVFSRRAVHAVAAVVARSDLPTSMIYGSLPYDVRHREAEKFASGETDVVVATDAIGMGMNLPIRRIVFLEQSKFDGRDKRFLNATEVRQIAGRAGRYGLHDVGFWKSANATRQMVKLMDENIPQIKTARLGFERPLLGVDGTVSQLMAKWVSMGVDEPFSKHDLEREQSLARELEHEVGINRASDTKTKRLVHTFATLPFKEQVTGLKTIWKQMFRAELDGIAFDVKVPSGPLPSGMEALEVQYAHMDLLHQYCRMFSHTEHYEAIERRRRAISDRISEIIAKSVFDARKCRECGKPLPWNWPYPMCDDCHDQLYPRRVWYGDWY